jgi:HPt (histidine-containing phosphotransfer) domain-containing protein
VTVLSKAGIDQVSAPSVAPADDAIDIEHLARMTLGDRGLEREVLQLFDRQVDILMPRLTGDDPAATAGAAHTLKGSARGIGAWAVATAAEAVEQLAGSRNRAEFASSVRRLVAVTDQVRVAIASRLKVR